MAAVDEIDALDKSIKDATNQLGQAKLQILTLRKQLTEAIDSQKKADEGAQLMWDRLTDIKRGSIVSIKLYEDTRSLFYRNKDLAASKRISVVTIGSNIAKIERSIPTLESAIAKLIETRSQYGQLQSLF